MQIITIDDYVSTNNVKFYFDYQNGEYGYNTSPLRGADTFSPFKKSLSSFEQIYSNGVGTGFSNHDFDYTFTKNYSLVIAVIAAARDSMVPNSTISILSGNATTLFNISASQTNTQYPTRVCLRITVFGDVSSGTKIRHTTGAVTASVVKTFGAP